MNMNTHPNSGAAERTEPTVPARSSVRATETQAFNAIYSRLGESENACVISLPKTVLTD